MQSETWPELWTRSILHKVMIPDLDIYRSADILVKQHGEDARIHAAMRADAMLEKGDLDGYAVWRRIGKATETLLTPRCGPLRCLPWPCSRQRPAQTRRRHKHRVNAL